MKPKSIPNLVLQFILTVALFMTPVAAVWMSNTFNAEAAQCAQFSDGTKFCELYPEEEDNSPSGGTDNIVLGNTGNNHLSGGNGDDILYGAEGDDVVSGNTGNDFLVGGSGHDKITDAGGSNEFYGGEGDDFIYTDFTGSEDSNKYF